MFQNQPHGAVQKNPLSVGQFQTLCNISISDSKSRIFKRMKYCQYRRYSLPTSVMPTFCGVLFVLLSIFLATDAFQTPVSFPSRQISDQSTGIGGVNSQLRSRTLPRSTSMLRKATDENQWEEPLTPEQGGGGNDNNNKFPKDDSFGNQFQRWWNSDEGKDDVRTYFLSLGFALLLRFTVIEPRFIPSLSMYPTFEVGDQLAVEKVTKRIKPFYRQEVVVFNPPQTFRDILVDQYGQAESRAKEALIKRIVAIEVGFVMGCCRF
jgi:hypothetical protein